MIRRARDFVGLLANLLVGPSKLRGRSAVGGSERGSFRNHFVFVIDIGNSKRIVVVLALLTPYPFDLARSTRTLSVVALREQVATKSAAILHISLKLDPKLNSL